jgi:uncharacterized 2Fe-2S/4Fe-4S cluster protein (DUF4445 family)
MQSTVRVELLPLGKRLEVPVGSPLQDVLFAEGVEFPCGGKGRCKGCRVRVLQGNLPPTVDDQGRLTPQEIAAGWRLSCQARADTDLQIDLAQWEATILADNRPFAFEPQEGLGIAIDLGTTTLVAQLVDLHTGQVLAVRSALNPQAKYGADIMSRVEYGCSAEGEVVLRHTILGQLGAMVQELADSHSAPDGVRCITVVGNTVMHHLFCGLNVQPLAHYPFESPDLSAKEMEAASLGWNHVSKAQVRFLPCLGGFVGSDILAGILATGLAEQDSLCALVDLGTNGEIVVGRKGRLLCASTAAGPAFEGAKISMGMRAATGAVSSVQLVERTMQAKVLGGGQPRGICGSGLVDAVAVGLELGWIQPSGKLANPGPLTIAAPVTLSQADVRELQLAKGAIAAGIRLLAERFDAQVEDLEKIYLAGAFGNYISRASAHRIGLLPFGVERVEPCGNTALLGAKLALFHGSQNHAAESRIRDITQHVSLNEDPHFHEVYVDEMPFARK